MNLYGLNPESLLYGFAWGSYNRPNGRQECWQAFTTYCVTRFAGEDATALRARRRVRWDAIYQIESEEN
jgi:hypothetical protein